MADIYHNDFLVPELFQAGWSFLHKKLEVQSSSGTTPLNFEDLQEVQPLEPQRLYLKNLEDFQGSPFVEDFRSSPTPDLKEMPNGEGPTYPTSRHWAEIHITFVDWSPWRAISSNFSGTSISFWTPGSPEPQGAIKISQLTRAVGSTHSQPHGSLSSPELRWVENLLQPRSPNFILSPHLSYSYTLHLFVLRTRSFGVYFLFSFLSF